MVGLLWEIYQQNRIGDAEARAANVGRRATDLEAELLGLERRLEQSMLINLAMGSLLQDKLGLTDAELERRMTDLDLADGKLDGRAGRAAGDGPKVCTTCRRTISKRHAHCFYCGALSPPTP
jgi:hypothetical protein